MVTKLPKIRIPSAMDLVNPLMRVEQSIIGLIPGYAQSLGLPVPPNLVGPVQIIAQIAGQIPTPPQPPDLPSPPDFPRRGGS